MFAERRTRRASRACARYGKFWRVRSWFCAFPFSAKLAPVLGRRRVTLDRSVLCDTICPSFRFGTCVNESLATFLRIAAVGLILLAALHLPIARHLKWREESKLLSPVNASIFRVHSFFICLVLVMMGMPCLVDPSVFLDRTRAG